MVLSPRILVTGFSLYNGYLYNPTTQIVEDLNGTVINGILIEGVVLPVSFKRAIPMLKSMLEERKPAIVLGLGFAPRASQAVLELAAANLAFFQIPDADGYKAEGEEIEHENELVVETRLPVKKIIDNCIKAQRLPLVPSVSIGTYLCNAVGYTIMSYTARYGAIGGFLHIPPTTDVAMRLGLKMGIPYRDIFECVLCVLKTSVDHATRIGILPDRNRPGSSASCSTLFSKP